MSEAIERIAGELTGLLAPLPARQRRRALGQLLARLDDNLAPEAEATTIQSRRALWFGTGALALGGALFWLSRTWPSLAPLSTVGQLVAFAGLFVLLGPLSRFLSNLLSGKPHP